MTNTVQTIATTLGETEEDPLAQIERLVQVLGEEQALSLLDETMTIEAEGGMLTKNGKRRRTAGGVFFKLTKSKITRQEKRLIFNPTRSGSRQKAKPPVKPMTWAEFQQLSTQILKSTAGEATTVKVTIIGRPGKVVEKGKVALTSMQSNKAPALPKGLPDPPADPTTYVVFIAMKQWRKVKDSLQENADDKLIIEGYPIFDERIGQNGAMTIYAQSVTTRLLQQAKREAQK